MAEDPRYRRQNIQLADVPQLQMTSIQESIKGSARLEQALDRISATAFKEISEQQQKRGMQYGLENAPSLEELNEATKAGITPAELFESDTTVFGKSAQKVQAKLVRAQLEYEARKDLTAVKELIKTGQITSIDDLDSELNGIVNGPSKYLAGVDAEESLGLRTSVLSRSREVRQYGVGKIVEAQQLLYEQELEDFMLDTTKSWVDKIESMPIKDPSVFNDETMNDALAIINKSGFLGAAKQAKTIERVREMQQDTIMLAISNQYSDNPDFLKNPAKYINDVQRGVVGEYTDMYASLPSDKKKQVVKDLRELYKQKHADEKFGYDLAVKENIVEFNALKDSYEKAEDPQTQRQLINQMRDISLQYPEVVTIDDIKKIKDGEYKVDPAIEYADSTLDFLEQIRTGQFLTRQQMVIAAENKGFDKTTINSLFDKELSSKQIRNQNAVITSIMLDNVGSKTPNNKKKKIEDNIKTKIQQKTEQDIPFDQAAEEVRNELANEKQQNKMKVYLGNLENAFKGFDDITDLYNTEYLNRDVDITDPEVIEILDQIKSRNETAYEDILTELIKIQTLRKEMDRE